MPAFSLSKTQLSAVNGWPSIDKFVSKVKAWFPLFQDDK